MTRAICDCYESSDDGTVTIKTYDDGYTEYNCQACGAEWDYYNDIPTHKIHGMYGADKE